MTTKNRTFKDIHPFEKRRSEASRIHSKHPNKIPVVVEKAYNSNIPTIDKNKYLVPDELTMGQFIFIIRKRIDLSPEKALFLFVNGNTLAPTAALMSNIYAEYVDDDGFLYILYTGENTFGDDIKPLK